MHILVLEAYDGGSHGRFLDGLIAHSRHEFTRLGLPARKWKWRMRGSAIYFATELSREPCPNNVDLLFTSDMTAVADLRALLPKALGHKPIVCYFHENQLTYPIPDESQRDYQYGFTNITSCLAADAVWFNSRYHLDSFLAGADSLLRKMPDYVPEGLVERIAEKATVMPLGLDEGLSLNDTPSADTCADSWSTNAACDPPTGDSLYKGHANASPLVDPTEDRGVGPTVLWNHRWEYDKNPDEFFETLLDLDRSGVAFRLVVAGQQFRDCPAIFEAAQRLLAHRVDHYGYAADRDEYVRLLQRSDIVVSTAVHEFFGLSVLEAIAAGCYPLLPRRLSYPELLPARAHSQHLYSNGADLRDKLERLCRNWPQKRAADLDDTTAHLAWPCLATAYDEAFEHIANSLAHPAS